MEPISYFIALTGMANSGSKPADFWRFECRIDENSEDKLPAWRTDIDLSFSMKIAREAV